MPALPAITFLGLRGMAAWAAVAAVAGGGLYVARRAIPALTGAPAGASASVGASPTAELLAGLLRAGADTGARVATASLGPGVSIATSGVRLAGDVTGALERFAERQTSVIGDVTREVVRSNTRQAEALIDLVERPRAVEARGIVLPPTRRVEESTPKRLDGGGSPSTPPVVVPVVSAAPAPVRLEGPAVRFDPRTSAGQRSDSDGAEIFTPIVDRGQPSFAFEAAGGGTAKIPVGKTVIGYAPNGDPVFA